MAAIAEVPIPRPDHPKDDSLTNGRRVRWNDQTPYKKEELHQTPPGARSPQKKDEIKKEA